MSSKSLIRDIDSVDKVFVYKDLTMVYWPDEDCLVFYYKEKFGEPLLCVKLDEDMNGVKYVKLYDKLKESLQSV